MVEHVFVTRHGARIDNGPDADRAWLTKAGHGRRDDPHLSPSGKAAAEELAAALARGGIFGGPDSHIVCSPYVRCIETAAAVAQHFGLPIKVEDGLSEVGTAHHKILARDQLRQQFPSIDIDVAYEPVISRSAIAPEHGDGQAAERARAAAIGVRRRLSGPLLLVGHGASCLGLVSAFGGSGYVGYTSLSHFTREEGGEWRLQGQQGDVSHLSDQATALRSAW